LSPSAARQSLISAPGVDRSSCAGMTAACSSNQTCRFPASGSPTGFTARHTERITNRKRRVRAACFFLCRFRRIPARYSELMPHEYALDEINTAPRRRAPRCGRPCAAASGSRVNHAPSRRSRCAHPSPFAPAGEDADRGAVANQWLKIATESLEYTMRGGYASTAIRDATAMDLLSTPRHRIPPNGIPGGAVVAPVAGLDRERYAKSNSIIRCRLAWRHAGVVLDYAAIAQLLESPGG
jgi:hypothetical protein